MYGNFSVRRPLSYYGQLTALGMNHAREGKTARSSGSACKTDSREFRVRHLTVGASFDLLIVQIPDGGQQRVANVRNEPPLGGQIMKFELSSATSKNLTEWRSPSENAFVRQRIVTD